MSIVEGFGDEVLICVVVLAIIGVLSMAWFSTDVHPVWNAGSIWLVQLQTHPNRRVLQVVSLDERQLDQVSENRNNLNDSTETQHIIVEQRNSNETGTVTHVDTSRRLSSSNENSNINSPSAPKEATTSQASTSVDQVPVDVEPEISANDDEIAPNTTIKLKFLDDTHKLVGAWLSQTVGQFKRQHFTTEVNQGKTIRLIYQGQLLRDDGRSLESYGLHDNCVLHCHIGIVPYTGGQPAAAAVPQHVVPAAPVVGGGGRRVGTTDMGQYVYLVFGVKFTLLWLAWYSYPQIFSTTSVVSLILCTGLYLMFVYSGRNRRNQQQQPQQVNQAN